MNCKSARNLFSPRLDGQLDYREQHRLSEHLDSCRECAAEFHKLERTVQLVRSIPEEQAPPEFLQNVLARVRESRRVPVPVEEPGLWERIRTGIGTLGWSPRVVATALSLGLVVGIGGSVLLLRPTGPEIAGVGPATISQQAVTSSTPSAPDASPFVSSPVSTPAPSGPFEDLVQEMLKRAETQEGAASDTVVATEPDWGQDRDLTGVGRQVNAGGPPAPESRQSQSQNREGRVYIVF